MTRERKIGILAALGGIAAGIALLTGLPQAQADELADLRVNQQLLQQRLDQLAQAAAVPPAASLLRGSFPRSILIPGTDTSLSIGGFIDETLDYWLTGGPANGNQTTTVGSTGQLPSVPLDIHGQTVPGYPTPGNVVPVNVQHSRGHVFSQSPRESRLRIETRTPSAWGPVGTVMEFDFAGTNANSGNNLLHVSDNLIPRLRLAYATIGGLLVGQAYGNTVDLAANPEVLDFGGPVGEWGANRIPQVRYTFSTPFGTSIAVSAETPDTDIVTPSGLFEQDSNINCANYSCSGTTALPLGVNPAKNTAPDLTAVFELTRPWGHFRLQGVMRNLDFQDGHFISREYIGFGGGFAGNLKPGWFGWSKDNFQFQAEAGKGLGHYINDSANAALATNYTASPATLAAARNILVKPITAFGAAVGYQHWWTPEIRSTLAVGIEHDDISSQLIGPVESTAANKELFTTHANLIWSPVSFIDVGLEYVFGHRVAVANLKGDENVVISKFRVRF
ncbi:MAG TPA: porin [Stellaceae bacterium]|nr:porin [Stellaceae bacterium]